MLHYHIIVGDCNREKALEACRILYHLREGPLIDGPAAVSLQSFIRLLVSFFY